jgi:putative two-component system response regulator
MSTVLVVDDERGPREALRMILKDEFTVLTADSGESAAALVRSDRPDAVLLDIRLGLVDGIEALRAIRTIDQAAQVAMITAYASVETARLAMQLGAVDYLTKPFDYTAVRQVVRGLVARREAVDNSSEAIQNLQEANAALTQRITVYQEQMQTNYSGTIVALISAIDAKDRYTRDHSIRVALLAQAISEELSLPADVVKAVRIAGLIHDVGKIGIPELVLRKQGKLSADEWIAMKRHPTIGADIISPVPSLAAALPGVLEHHERPDGKGYPAGLAGGAIAPVARVLAVADAIDAMSSTRAYSGPLDPERVTGELLGGAGTQWFPEIVNAAVRLRLPRRHHEYTAPQGPFPLEAA